MALCCLRPDLQGVAGSWGGASAAMLCPPARTLNLEEFILEAASCGATVILAMDDSLTTSGQLQVRSLLCFVIPTLSVRCQPAGYKAISCTAYA